MDGHLAAESVVAREARFGPQGVQGLKLHECAVNQPSGSCCSCVTDELAASVGKRLARGRPPPADIEHEVALLGTGEPRATNARPATQYVKQAAQPHACLDYDQDTDGVRGEPVVPLEYRKARIDWLD